MIDDRHLCGCGHPEDDHVHGLSECVRCMCDGYLDQNELEREDEEE